MSRKSRWYREQRCIQRKTKYLRQKESMSIMRVNIFEATQKQRGEKRSKKTKYTAPKQRILNTERKREYFKALVHVNFDESDYIIHKTFDKDITKEEADKEWTNALRRINRKRKKVGLGNARYILVSEGNPREGQRMHFHIIMDGDLHRDVIQDIWKEKGYINVDRLQFNDEGVTGLVKYVTKALKKEQEEEKEELGYDEDDGGTKAWRPSQGLVKPKINVRDYRFTKKQVMDWIRVHPSEREIEELYPGWTCTYINKKYNEEYGKAYIQIELRKYEKNEKVDNGAQGPYELVDGVLVNRILYKPIKPKRKKENKT